VVGEKTCPKVMMMVMMVVVVTVAVPKMLARRV